MKLKPEENLSDNTKAITVNKASNRTALIQIKREEISKHRTNIKEVLRWSNATPIRRYGDMGYMCCYCNDHYKDPAELKKHTLEIHDDIRTAYFFKLSLDSLIIRLDITSLRCKICEQSLDTVDQLMKHLMIEHQKMIYTDINNHITPLKFVTDTLQCCICKSAFSKFKMLLEHLNIHYRNYICKICDSGFAYKSSLRTHMQRHDTGTFKCDICSQVFRTNSNKKAHVRALHVFKQSLYKCGYCNETFAELRFKEAHLISMHGFVMPTSKCQACDKVFKDRKQLSLHVKRDHLLERRHQCPECDMKFFKGTELKNHMVKHTGIKTFKCAVCLKAFTRASSVKQHMKIHNNVRQFKCEHCGQAFVQKCSWRGHMRAKHGEIV